MKKKTQNTFVFKKLSMRTTGCMCLSLWLGEVCPDDANIDDYNDAAHRECMIVLANEPKGQDYKQHNANSRHVTLV